MALTVPPAVVFLDLDGCLVDSTRAITGSLNHALSTLGLAPRPVHELTRFIGPPLTENAATLLAEAEADQALATALVELYRGRYVEIAATDTVVFPGIPTALDRLAVSAVLAVVTSKPQTFARQILAATGLIDRFAAIHAPDLDEHAEPKTTTLQRALDDVAAGVAAAATVMVGDRRYDVEAGRVCGTATVGVTWGAGERGELEAAGADAMVDTPHELAGLLTDATRRL